jgi:hypothetical protein
MKAKMFHAGWVLFATRNMIHDMMLEWKNSNKNCSVMLKQTHYNPTVNIVTRWTSYGTMLSKYSKTTDAFIEASKHPDSSITLPTNVRSFDATVEAASKCLEDVNVCVKELQTSSFLLHNVAKL